VGGSPFGSRVRFSRQRRTAGRHKPAPALSEHRDALLAELGYDAAARAALVAGGGVR
jgi:crotonobetainyl-CoA:carnitine CoA-transferase CaiB-like acyl-CoA transferase